MNGHSGKNSVESFIDPATGRRSEVEPEARPFGRGGKYCLYEGGTFGDAWECGG